MTRREELSDEQWAILEPIIPEVVPWADGRGRQVVHNDRAVLNGILWRSLPRSFDCLRSSRLRDNPYAQVFMK